MPQVDDKLVSDVTKGSTTILICLGAIREAFSENVAHKAFITTFIDYLADETVDHLHIFVQMFNGHRGSKKKSGRLMFVEGEA